MDKLICLFFGIFFVWKVKEGSVNEKGVNNGNSGSFFCYLIYVCCYVWLIMIKSGNS